MSIMYDPGYYSEPVQALLIAAIIFGVLAIVALAVSCYRGSRAKKAREAAAAGGLPGPNGPPMQALPLTVTQVQAGFIVPAGMQSFPIYVTNQRGQNGEELVLVPRHILQQPLQQLQHQQHQQQQQQQQPGPSSQSVVQPPLPPRQVSLDQKHPLGDEEEHLRSLEAIRQSSGAYLGDEEGNGAGVGGSSSSAVPAASLTANRGE
ncbi:hypothetical protein BGZ68_007566, partial [Mortierella alpina]